MDLFHFSMQQLAQPLPRLGAEVLPAAHKVVAAWLRHHHYLAAGQRLRADQRLREDLDLDDLGRVEMMGDLEVYYDIVIPDAEISGLATVGDVAACLGHQLLKAAA